MNEWRMRAATTADVEAVVDLLNEAGARLANRGLDQWGIGWMSCQRMLPMIKRGETWLAEDNGGIPFVTVSLSEEPDPDFWTPEEQRRPALYLNKLASRVRGAGGWAIEWALRHAGTLGYEVIRLDAWATNTELHDYYRARGWTHLRTMRVPGRRSGALFEKKTTREQQMIVPSTLNLHPPETPTAAQQTRPEVLVELTGTLVRGVAPFQEQEHVLVLPLGMKREVWHDGTDWRVAHKGWGDRYADYVVRWPLLEELSPKDRYVVCVREESEQEGPVARLSLT